MQTLVRLFVIVILYTQMSVCQDADLEANKRCSTVCSHCGGSTSLVRFLQVGIDLIHVDIVQPHVAFIQFPY
jgi:hypothetical protein